MKILLTGANGFVGRHVIDRLEASALPEMDIRNRQPLLDHLGSERYDAVIHLAAQSFVPESFRNPQETLDVNFGGTFNLLEALKSTGFKGRLLFVSSGDTYGKVAEEQLPIREDHPLRPRNPYAVSKVAAEALCYQYSQTEAFEVVMARAFNHIGTGQSERFAVSDFARQIAQIALGQRPPALTVGDIDVSRDFLDVRDVVDAYHGLLQHGRNGEPYNVCSGIERTLRSVIERLQQLAGTRAELIQEGDRMRRAEQRRVLASNEKITRDTGWHAGVDFDSTLRDLLDYWKGKLK